MPGIFSSYIQHPKKMQFYGEDGDEKIILVLRKHLITNFKWVVIALLLLSAPIAAPILFASLNIQPFQDVPAELILVTALLWYLITIGYVFQKYLLWYFNVNIVSDKRVVDMDFSHFLSRNFTDAPLRNIEDVTHTISGALQIIFNFGNVLIQTAADEQEIEFDKIPQPAKVQDLISDIVAALKINSYDNN